MSAAINFRGTGRCSTCGRSTKPARVVAAKAVIKMPDSVSPRGNLVYVKVQSAEEQTTGGVLLPGSAQRRPTSGQVVSVGDGRLAGGKTMEFTVKAGDEVLFSKFGFAFTEFELKGEQYILIKEHDIIGVMPRADAIADDLPEMKPMGDRVMIKINQTTDVSAGGVFLPDSAKERPLSGTVVSVGPGKTEDDGSRSEMSVKAGDKVVYFKYAGDNMETTDGTQYVVVHERDILCKAE